MTIITNFMSIVNNYFFDEDKTTIEMIGYYMYLLAMVIAFITVIILNITF